MFYIRMIERKCGINVIKMCFFCELSGSCAVTTLTGSLAGAQRSPDKKDRGVTPRSVSVPPGRPDRLFQLVQEGLYAVEALVDLGL